MGYYQYMAKEKNYYTISNSISNFLELFDEGKIVESLKELDANAKNTRFLQVTNPIASSLIAGCGYNGNKLVLNQTRPVRNSDYMYFILTASLLKLLKKELKKSPNYLDELYSALFSRSAGPALTKISELTAAGYYKEQGKRVQLNSSKEEGMPDVYLPEEEFATDVKSFPNNDARLGDALNECRKEAGELFKLIKDTDILFFIHDPDRKHIQAALAEITKDLRDTGSINQDYGAISTLVVDDSYKAAELVIEIGETNSRLHFQSNWALDNAVDGLDDLLEKSVEQSSKANKQAVTWVWFPGDAANHAIQMNVVRYVTGLHGKVENNESLDGVVCYSISAVEENKTSIASDVYGHKLQQYGITKDNVNEFLEKHLSMKEYLIHRS